MEGAKFIKEAKLPITIINNGTEVTNWSLLLQLAILMLTSDA